MNDPDPSLSSPSSKADRPESDAQVDNGDAEPHQPKSNWFTSLIKGWMSGLTNPSLRSQMEGALADENSNDQTFSAEEKAMLRNILELREMRVSDVMIPRADIDAIEDEISLGTLLAVYQDVGHSRLPVYRETLDDPVGMVHIKDVLSLLTKECCIPEPSESPALDSMEGSLTSVHFASDGEMSLANLPRTLSNINLDRPLKDLGVIRDVLFVPPSMQAIDLMATMRAARTQMALVIDEYGGTDGLVSLEDIVETVVGDIEDEHDDEDEIFIAGAGPNLFIADAKAELDDVIEAIGTDLPQDDESMEDVDTLGGFIFTLIGRIPVRGELITVKEGLEFEIMEADRRRIRRVKIRLKPIKKPFKRAFSLHKPSDAEEGEQPAEHRNDAAAE
ncbi:CBS domain-containing protein [Cohaesibacter marisflavi]|uniref:CBS domain-containing protein n=1 Tax=Cohaesibacter marisflavi TaxID=655353 RepID=A0A1I5GTU9_9HYPH|nr:hemolysin family protein [Cohaesibacter marisflavi]SFO39357.1 CBS domain-containing protein [Cohaesibacter marisflavi]